MPNRSENPEEVAKYLERQAVTKPLIDQMVDRFLAWELPQDFRPDGGISFDPHRLGSPRLTPIGTNLLHAGQAKAMLEHVAAPLLARLEVIRKWYDENKDEEHWIAAGGSTCAKDCPLCKVEEALGL